MLLKAYNWSQFSFIKEPTTLEKIYSLIVDYMPYLLVAIIAWQYREKRDIKLEQESLRIQNSRQKSEIDLVKKEK